MRFFVNVMLFSLRLSVEAAIVRIMKTRKTLDHANLVAEVSKLLAVRFQASPQVHMWVWVIRAVEERGAVDTRSFCTLCTDCA